MWAGLAAGRQVDGAIQAASVARHNGSPAEMWAWLHRRWSPDADERWDGLPRGIARGLPDPAIDVCLHWAASAVATPVEVDRNALPRRHTIVITAGRHTSRPGTIEPAAWRVNDAGDDLLSGPSQAYLVTVIATEGKPVQDVLTTDDFTVTAIAPPCHRGPEKLRKSAPEQ